MKIEAGKYYRMRDGNKAYVAGVVKDEFNTKYPVSGYRHMKKEDEWISVGWKIDGNYFNDEPNDKDIIAEWDEPNDKDIIAEWDEPKEFHPLKEFVGTLDKDSCKEMKEAIRPTNGPESDDIYCITYKDTLPEENYQRLRAQIEEFWPKNKPRPILLEGGLAVVKL